VKTEMDPCPFCEYYREQAKINRNVYVATWVLILLGVLAWLVASMV